METRIRNRVGPGRAKRRVTRVKDGAAAQTIKMHKNSRLTATRAHISLRGRAFCEVGPPLLEML